MNAWRRFLVARVVLIDRINDDLVTAGVLPLDAFDTLRCLQTAPDRRLRLTDLAAVTLVTRSGVTRVADRLEASGLIRRQHCPSDRRVCYAALTDQGEEEMRRTWPVLRAAILSRFGIHLSEDAARCLDESFGEAIAAIRADERLTLGLPQRPQKGAP